MQHAIPYRTWVPGWTAGEPRPPANVSGEEPIAGAGAVRAMVLENAVVVFGRRGCCMCHVLKRLLLGHGVNPPVFQVDEDGEAAVAEELSKVNTSNHVKKGGGIDINGNESSNKVQFPVVFVGGKVFGGLERVMATHISGELVPILKEAGALWL
ncbi:hypothetical protein L484_015048 [Morus notabilis]|uniref:Glutaredoxin domain-containing protein n=1 Tax=Morus notabilis TaxID=981085 RepID=W9SHP4_9ROSA|nr:glutaredoxin-C9 [Morus notabilis]EXC30557.1 hypothetical protein L484_015048 [Morus notabilis]